MADFTKFRSSMGGFRRSDVTNYIEALCAEHRQALKSLQDDKDALSAQLQEQTEKAETLQQQLTDAQTALSSTEAAFAEAMLLLEEQTDQQEQAPDYPALELEAYRRAEAAERLAVQRADRLQQRLDELLDNVSARFRLSGQDVQVLSEDLRENLRRLQDTLSELEVVFAETSGRFDALQTDESSETANV